MPSGAIHPAFLPRSASVCNTVQFSVNLLRLTLLREWRFVSPRCPLFDTSPVRPAARRPMVHTISDRTNPPISAVRRSFGLQAPGSNNKHPGCMHFAYDNFTADVWLAYKILHARAPRFVGYAGKFLLAPQKRPSCFGHCGSQIRLSRSDTKRENPDCGSGLFFSLCCFFRSADA